MSTSAIDPNRISQEAMARHASEAARFPRCLANENRRLVLSRLTEDESALLRLREQVSVSPRSARREAANATRREAQTILYHLADLRVRRLTPRPHALFRRLPKRDPER